MEKKDSALVLFSGGQDSTTCLAWALSRFEKVYAIAFDYGQRHRRELDCARDIASRVDVDLKVMKIDLFSELTKNALTNHDMEITPQTETSLPSTFVPGRNHVFLSLAAIYAYQLGVVDIVTGTCQTDYSGYPDCREEFIRSLQQSLCLAMDSSFTIHTPLMHLTKKETVEMMDELGKIDLLAYTNTCYEGGDLACGQCPACRLRLKGFKEAGVDDPLSYVS